jgi:hypothetical protein
MCYFLRVTKYSDKNWFSYRMPVGHNWNDEEFEILQDMIDVGAYQTKGLAKRSQAPQNKNKYGGFEND